jgi:hypothetical protein
MSATALARPSGVKVPGGEGLQQQVAHHPGRGPSPGRGGDLDVIEAAPRSTAVDELVLVEAVHGLGQRASYESPTVPIDGAAPMSARRSV